MSAELIRRMRKSRETIVEVGKYTFTIKRPTDAEMSQFHKEKISTIGLAKWAVIGWRGVLQSDLVDKGNSEEVPFSRELWEEWCNDTPELWSPISDKVLECYSNHIQAKEDAEKN